MVWGGMKLIRTLAAWRPDLTGYRDVEEAYKIALKSLAHRYLELHDEVAELDDMIEAIVKELAPELIARNSVGLNSAAQLLLTAGDNPDALDPKPALLPSAVSVQSPHRQEKRRDTD